MKNILVLLIAVFALSFGARDRLGQGDYTKNYNLKPQRFFALEKLPDLDLKLDGVTSIDVSGATLNVYGSYNQIDTEDDAAVSTVNIISQLNAGDIVIIRSSLASQDIVFQESNVLHLGGATRTLSDPSDIIMLMGIPSTDATAVSAIEVSFVDNK